MQCIVSDKLNEKYCMTAGKMFMMMHDDRFIQNEGQNHHTRGSSFVIMEENALDQLLTPLDEL